MGHQNVVNERDVDAEEKGPSDNRFERKRLARVAGGEKLGCSLYRVAPGRRT